MNEIDEEATLSPEASLALLTEQQEAAFGVWLSVVNAAGVLAGPGWHSLLVSVLGGGGMLAVALCLRLRRRRPTATVG